MNEGPEYLDNLLGEIHERLDQLQGYLEQFTGVFEQMGMKPVKEMGASQKLLIGNMILKLQKDLKERL